MRNRHAGRPLPGSGGARAMTAASAGHRALAVAAAAALLNAGISGPTRPVTAISGPQIPVLLAADPVQPYLDLVSDTLSNLGGVAARWLDAPLPILGQIIANWADYLQTVVGTTLAAGHGFLDGLANLPGQLQMLFETAQAGDVIGTVAMVIITFLSANPLPAVADRLLSLPYAVGGNLVGAAMATLHALQVPVGTGALGAVQASAGELDQIARTIGGELQSGDIAGVVTQLVAAPALFADALLNSSIPDQPGLLTATEDPEHTGLVDALLNALPDRVAAAIAPPEDPLPDPAP